MARAHTRDYRNLYRVMFVPRDPLRLLHEQSAEALVLKLGRIAIVDGHHGAVDVQLAYDRAATLQLGPEGGRAALAKSEQADEDVLLGVLVRQEGLPRAVCGVVTPHELHLVRLNLKVDVLDAHFAGAHVAALEPELCHASECQLAQITVLHTARHQRHGNVALNAVHASPRRHQGQDAGNEIDQGRGVIVLVAASAPEFVEASAANNKRRIELESVSTKVGALEELAEALVVALHAHIRQIRHHVHHHLVASVLCELECIADIFHAVPAISVASNILVDALHADFQSSTAVIEHVIEMLRSAVVRSSLNCDTNTLGVALLRVPNCLTYVI
eukprot:Mycagemm_TRINITY_DN10189_c0_g1::TRINITY_DN10189_c0_g1_i2::g.5113::m.5113 type:complete len:331 gc:universal TRINITY_DN10189_c0_g1_i2:1783-791(-)